MSNFQSPSEMLAARWSSLQTQWSQCRDEWNDPIAERFEREFWSEWQATLPSAINLLQELEEAIADAESNID